MNRPFPAPLLPACLLLATLLAAAPAGAQNPTPPTPHAAAKHAHKVPVVQPPKHGAAQATAQKPAAPAASAPTPAQPAPAQPAPAPPQSAGTPGAADKGGEPGKGSVTGLPIPRFAALRSDDVNLRAGPGTRYPIDWVYKRRGLPVEIDREFELWRLVTTPDGTRGWVHQATLVGRRSFVVTGEERTMRNAPRPGASPVARLKPGVVGRLRRCDAGSDWCEVQVGDYRGWLKRSEFWGTLPGEAVQ